MEMNTINAIHTEVTSFLHEFWDIWPYTISQFTPEIAGRLRDCVIRMQKKYPHSAMLHVYLGNISKNCNYYDIPVDIPPPICCYESAIKNDLFCTRAYNELASFFDVKELLKEAEMLYEISTFIDAQIETLIDHAGILEQLNDIAKLRSIVKEGSYSCSFFRRKFKQFAKLIDERQKLKLD
ncbi:MAG: hypothetical protein LBC74_05200 [Planctomycetaceae bacterium]|jgi:hypothetical protein|nr:hypothetical protein [Planctomycetaceae bacterium]